VNREQATEIGAGLLGCAPAGKHFSPPFGLQGISRSLEELLPDLADSWAVVEAHELGPGPDGDPKPMVVGLRDGTLWMASVLRGQDERRQRAQVSVERHPPENWRVVRVFDDLRSEGDIEGLNRTWQVELGVDQARGSLRFGDGEPGSPLPSGTAIEVTYRIGGGEAGNVAGAPIGEPTEPVRRIASRSTGAMSREEVLGRALAAAQGWEIHDFATEHHKGGDYTRYTFDPRRHHSGVQLQQGRVELEGERQIKSTDGKERDGGS
jgi:hypothetical protein